MMSRATEFDDDDDVHCSSHGYTKKELIYHFVVGAIGWRC